MAAASTSTAMSWRRAVPSAPDLVRHLGFLAAVLVAWQLLAGALSPVMLPPVTDVLQAMVDITISGELPLALGESALLLAVGLAVATLLGFAFGVVIGRSQIAHWTLSPYFSALFVTPTVALVPLVLVWFGFGMTGRVLVVVIAALVPVLLSVSSALRDDPGELVEVARSFGVHGEVPLLRHVRLRAAVPVIMSGIRLAVGRAVVGMAVAETYLRLGGIGGLIRAYGATFQTAYVFATIVPLSLLGILLVALVGRIERHYQGWRA